jgi:hypothetical protein
MIQLAYAETRDNFRFDNNAEYGKYRFTVPFLQRYGYLNQSINQQLDQAGSWTSKNGIDSAEDLKSSSGLQDIIMQEFLVDMYKSLCLIQGIRENDTKMTAAGMLAVAYQFQNLADPARTALTWRNTARPLDSKGRPGYVYYNYGRYAIQRLAQSPGSNTPSVIT